MHLIQIFLPVYDNEKKPIPKNEFTQARTELVDQFGGLTAYARSPASGLWQEDQQHTVHDELIIYEVMSETLDEQWWRDYRIELEQRFKQESIVVRVQDIRLL